MTATVDDESMGGYIFALLSILTQDGVESRTFQLKI